MGWIPRDTNSLSDKELISLFLSSKEKYHFFQTLTLFLDCHMTQDPIIKTGISKEWDLFTKYIYTIWFKREKAILEHPKWPPIRLIVHRILLCKLFSLGVPPTLLVLPSILHWLPHWYNLSTLLMSLYRPNELCNTTAEAIKSKGSQEISESK